MGIAPSASFSCNLYSELSIENLQREYQKNVAELIDFNFDKKSPLLYHNVIRQDYRQYVRQRMVDKHKQIKSVLLMYIRTRGLRPELQDPFHGWADIRQEDIDNIE